MPEKSVKSLLGVGGAVDVVSAERLHDLTFGSSAGDAELRVELFVCGLAEFLEVGQLKEDQAEEAELAVCFEEGG